MQDEQRLKTTNIFVELPFDWCEGCRSFSIEESSTFYAEGTPYYKRYTCQNERICIDCESQREAYIKNESNWLPEAPVIKG